MIDIMNYAKINLDSNIDCGNYYTLVEIERMQVHPLMTTLQTLTIICQYMFLRFYLPVGVDNIQNAASG